MFTRKLVLIHLLVLFLASITNGQTVQWASSWGDWVDDNAYNTVFDGEGNVYVTGRAETGLLVKFDKFGNKLWHRIGKLSHNAYGAGLALDSQGNIYIGGTYSYTLDLGDTVLHGQHQTKGFIAKYSSAGKVLWAKNLGDNKRNSWDSGGYLTIDQEDNVYISCSFSGNIVLDNGIVIEDNYPNYWPDTEIYLLKFDKNGRIQWGKSAGTFNDDFIVCLKTSPDNKIYMGVQSSSTEFTFGDKKYPIPNSSSVILSCNTDGKAEWLTPMTGRLHSLDLDEKGNIYAAGIFYSEIKFDGAFTLKSNISNSKFLVKYRPDKAIEWSREIEAVGEWRITTAASNGHVYVSSSFHQYVNAGQLSLQGSGSMDVFLLRFNEVGHAQWFKRISSDAPDYAHWLAISNEGRIALLGSYSGTTMNLDGNLLKNNSGNSNTDVFLALTDDPVPNKCPQVTPNLSADKEVICVQDKAILTAGGNNNYPVQWYKNDQAIDFTSEESLQVSEVGEYFFVVYDGSACATASNRISVSMVEAPDKSLAVAPAYQSCDSKPIQVQAVKKDSYSYQWFMNGVLLEGQHESFVSAAQSGKYHVVITNEGICSSVSDVVSLEVLPAENDFLPDTVFRCQNEVVVLSPDKLNYEEWSFLWSTNETSSSLEVTEEGLYILSLFKGDCAYTDQVYIKNYKELSVPNVITPNGDHKNDFFVIRNLTKPVHLFIYDRWGTLVYEDKNYNNTWSAEGLTTGTYYYFISDELNCRTENRFKGWIQVIR